ncbi:5-alpha-L-arabinanase) [Durusdinium trenchii]|uniref:5-alpha-L-arabinanase n=1 Tax=Durusdinium trenchii TaxID=1381693 RepID=A0ABP0LKS9_9DINO
MAVTGGGPEGAFRMLRSNDLVSWEPCGKVFSPETLPSWSGGAHGQKCDYWAPEIHQLPGAVGIFFSAREPSPGRALHVGLATAKSPEGPYRDLGQPLLSDPHGAIDPSYFHDEATGKHYVLWKVDGNAHKVPSVIKIRELDATGTGLAEGSEVELLHSELPWEGGVVEGPFLVKRGEMYYLFYSGECYGNHRYCVGVARAEQVLCPYTKSGAPILSSGTGWAGPGHCVVLDVGGRDVMIFHAWPSDTPGGRGPRGKGRAVLMEQVVWEDAWPLVGAGVPCAGPQPRPLGPRGPQQPPQPPLRVNGTYRLRVAQGWDAFLGYDGRLSKATDQVFTCRVGFRPGGTVSLEGEKGRFLRHREGRLELSAPASGSFAADATWMALPGLAAGDELRVSLRAVNFPERRNSFEMNETFLLDATWIVDAWSNNVQRNIVVHQQQNDPNFTGPKKPQGYRVSQSPGGPSSINLSWNEAPNRAPSPARVAKPEAPVGGARGASPARMLEVVHPSRLPSGVAAVPQEAASPAGVGVRQPSPANGRYERYEGAAGLAGPPAQRHPCYGDPQVHAGGAAPRAMPSYDPQAAGLAHPPAGRHPCYGDPQVNLAQPSGPSTQQARPLYDPQAPAAGAKAPAPAQRHPCYGDPQAAALPPRRTPSPCNGRAKEVPMAAAGFQAHQMHRGGAPYAYDGGPAAGLPPPLPREARAQDQPLGREQPRVSSNAYACGGNQNCGNVITDRRSTRVAQPPGGSSSICFG